MKLSKLFLLAIAAFALHLATACADDKLIPAEQLPEAARTFIQKSFPNESITFVQKDGFFRPTYEVRLNNGTEIEFDNKGVWDSMDCKRSSVPENLIPAEIVKYVKAKFTNILITKIDKERKGYEIELSDGLELKFDKNGALISVDD